MGGFHVAPNLFRTLERGYREGGLRERERGFWECSRKPFKGKNSSIRGHLTSLKEDRNFFEKMGEKSRKGGKKSQKEVRRRGAIKTSLLKKKTLS